jgi:hypothetical protein
MSRERFKELTISLFQAMGIGWLVLLGILPAQAGSPAAGNNVLIIHSYHAGLSWTELV